MDRTHTKQIERCPPSFPRPFETKSFTSTPPYVRNGLLGLLSDCVSVALAWKKKINRNKEKDGSREDEQHHVGYRNASKRSSNGNVSAINAADRGCKKGAEETPMEWKMDSIQCLLTQIGVYKIVLNISSSFRDARIDAGDRQQRRYRQWRYKSKIQNQWQEGQTNNPSNQHGRITFFSSLVIRNSKMTALSCGTNKTMKIVFFSFFSR